MFKSPEKKIHFEDDQKDFFVTFLEKKLNNKNLSKENKEFYERCRDTYIEALKNKPSNAEAKAKEDAHNKLISKEHDKEVRYQTICDLSNLIFFCNIFSNASKRNDFKENFEEIKSTLHLESYPDFDIFAEFYQKVFDFNVNKNSVKQQLENSIKEIEHYVNGSQNIALRQTSYHNLLHTVNKVMNSQYFGNHKDRRPSMSLNINASGNKLATALIDKPLHGEEEANTEPKRERKFSTKSPAFKPSQNLTAPEELNLNNNDGFIEVQPKYILVKKSKQQQEQDRTKQYPKHKGKPKYHKGHGGENNDREHGREDRGPKKYVQKKIYTKKQEN